MSEHPAAPDPRAHRVLADMSRVAVLEALRRAGRPLSVPEIAAEVGLHPNTVRGHLAQLAEHGYVHGEPEDRQRPGRPRLLYSVTGKRAEGERRNYRLLAEALIAYLVEQDEERAAATAAGRSYGRRLVHRDPGVETDAEAGVRQIVDLLAEIGFQPRLSPDGARIDLHHCPFRELAERHPDAVCGMHLGIMRGALAELGAPVEVAALLPFVTPGRCEARLRRPPDDAR
ncbi:helix-turn-helix transcriptional regulator [Thermomonospora catenispora]|uniref:helix-turn-helix transcriptional regulator n=1 Tax=Thermomonospora catenispora TaxID=2493090 RepID=UPI0011210105|nr:helix-turn-helix domain-containing protein [Thermomonospora catenispora]TNY36291.1 ArsR family transcriptional regulator [Thermomonospora catenispora]